MRLYKKIFSPVKRGAQHNDYSNHKLKYIVNLHAHAFFKHLTICFPDCYVKKKLRCAVKFISAVGGCQDNCRHIVRTRQLLHVINPFLVKSSEKCLLCE